MIAASALVKPTIGIVQHSGIPSCVPDLRPSAYPTPHLALAYPQSEEYNEGLDTPDLEKFRATPEPSGTGGARRQSGTGELSKISVVKANRTLFMLRSGATAYWTL